MKKLLVSLLLSACLAFNAYAQTPVAWPTVVSTSGPTDFGNGPLKIRILSGIAYIFTSQGSGLGSTAGSSTALTLTTTPPTATKPIVGAVISGAGITAGTTIAAYNGTTGVTLSAAMTVAASTPLTWGAACPSAVGNAPYVSASAGAEYYTAYTASRICGVSPGSPSEYVTTVPYPEPGSGSSSGGSSSTFGATFPTTGTAVGMSQGGNMVALTGTSNNLNVQCANCSGSGVSAADAAAFTAGTSLFAPSGGFFQTTATANPLTNGKQGFVQMTAQRAFFTNLRDATGVEIGTSTTPVQVSVANTGANGTAIKVDGSAVTQPASIATWAGGALGSMANYGTSPGAVLVPGVNANITNTVTVSGTVTAANASVSATGAAVPGSATYGGLSDGTNLNGWLSAKNALNSTGAGIGTAQGIGQFDDVAPTAITENQFGNLRISANRNLYGTIRDAAGNERGVNVSAGNALIVDASATTQPVSAVSLPLPALASTSTKQSDGTQKTQIVDGSGNVIASTSNNLNVQCANCSGSGVSTADEASFTAGTSLFAGSGGFFQTTATNNPLTTGQQGMFQLTANRALFSNLRNASGAELGVAAAPLQVSLANTGANTNKLLVTPDSVALPANQSVNVAQVNGVTTLTGTGAVGTGAQRVAVGTDTATIAGSAPGTAGTASVNVISVQGIASMTPLLANPGTAANWGVQTQGSTTSGQSGPLVQGAVTTAPPSYTTAQTSPLSLDLAGNLRINCITGCGGGSGGTASADEAAFTFGTTSLTLGGGVFQTTATNNALTTGQGGAFQVTANRALFTNLRNASGTEIGVAATELFVGGRGTAGSAAGGVVTVQGVASMTPLLANPGTAANWGVGATGAAVPANAIFAGLSDGTNLNGWLSAKNALNSTGAGVGTAQIVGQCDDTSPTALTENQFGNARIDCANHAQLTTPVPSATAGGTSLLTLTLAASTNATNVKASAGQVYSISGFNMSSATPVWISLYNNAGTPTCGTSIIQQFMIPGNTTGAGFVHDFAMPKGFTTGIAFCATTGIAGTGSVAASTYVLNIDYK